MLQSGSNSSLLLLLKATNCFEFLCVSGNSTDWQMCIASLVTWKYITTNVASFTLFIHMYLFVYFFFPLRKAIFFTYLQ